MTEELGHFIGGKRVAGKSGRHGDVFNPAAGEVTTHVAFADSSEIDAAVAAAREAFPAWAATPPLSRARVMFKYKELLEQNRDKLARMIGSEHGKVLADATGEVTRGIEVVEFVCGIPQLLKGEFTENVGADIDSYGVRQALGRVRRHHAVQFPGDGADVDVPGGDRLRQQLRAEAVGARSLAGAVPRRAADASGPAGGRVQCRQRRQGAPSMRSSIIPDIEAVSFVGSTPIAEHVFHRASANDKRVQALGGAKNHMVVMPDADMGQAVDALMGAAYGSAGERCMAVSVAVTVGKAGDALIEQLTPRVQSLKLGPYTDPDAEMGPLVTREAYERVKRYVDIGVSEGAKLVVDGRGFRLQGYENGYFLGGCLFDNVTPQMRIYKEEIFGPVLAVVRAANYEEALGLVNAHEFGNGAAIFTRDGDAARDFSTRAKIGMIGVNVPIPVPMAFHSFGGWKRSLFGDHHVHGPEGVRFYTKLKTVISRWPTGIRAGAEFTMPTMR